MSLYILTDFDKFSMSKILVDLGVLVIIMTLTMIIFLRIDTSQLEVDRMVLKGFDKFSERAIGTITLTFGIDGWASKAKFYIIDVDTSFNVLLGDPGFIKII